MSLVPCRACKHSVDFSALACPNCGATNPGHKLSQQQGQLISFIVQLVLGFGVLYFVATKVWTEVGPFVKAQIMKAESN